MLLWIIVWGWIISAGLLVLYIHHEHKKVEKKYRESLPDDDELLPENKHKIRGLTKREYDLARYGGQIE